MTARDLHALLSHAADPRSDVELLADPAAHGLLVRRYGPLVWTVCRRLAPEPADAFQAVFLALAKSAARIRNPAAVGGWLHAAAVKVSLKQRRAIARRRLREKRVARAEAVVPVADAAWDEILAAVHEEVEGLPDGERVAFVVCELQGVPAGEAAKQLGWRPGTLTGRLSRARGRLLTRLSARGFAPAAGFTVVSAVPAEVLARVGPAATVPAAVATLSAEVTRMIGAKHLAAAVLVTAGLLAGVGGVVGQSEPLPPPKPTPPRTEQPKPMPPGAAELPGGGWPAWSHEVVLKPSNTDGLSRLLAERGQDGWEFAGMVDWRLEGKTTSRPDVLVFKRPAGGQRVPTSVAPPMPSRPTAEPRVPAANAPPRFGGGGPPDPEMVWGFMSKGQPTINLNDPDNARTKQRMIDQGQPIPPDGILTKEAFKSNFQASMEKRAAAAPTPAPATGPTGSGPPPTAGFDPSQMTDDQLKMMMKRYDTDGDGRVSAAEGAASDRLRDSFAHYDTNRDGFIDAAEYRAYMTARLQQRGQPNLPSPTVEPAPPASRTDRAEVVALARHNATVVAELVSPVARSVRVVADARSNALYLTGPQGEVIALAKLVRELDAGGVPARPGGEAATPVPPPEGRWTEVPLRNTAAADVSAALGRESRFSKLVTSTDPARNVLLLTGPADVVTAAADTAWQLDRPAVKPPIPLPSAALVGVLADALVDAPSQTFDAAYAEVRKINPTLKVATGDELTALRTAVASRLAGDRNAETAVWRWFAGTETGGGAAEGGGPPGGPPPVASVSVAGSADKRRLAERWGLVLSPAGAVSFRQFEEAWRTRPLGLEAPPRPRTFNPVR